MNIELHMNAAKSAFLTEDNDAFLSLMLFETLVF